MEYKLEYLKSLPTLCTSQADDLKIERPCRRVWLSRCGVEDGEPYGNKVTVEVRPLNGAPWYEVDMYQSL